MGRNGIIGIIIIIIVIAAGIYFFENRYAPAATAQTSTATTTDAGMPTQQAATTTDASSTASAAPKTVTVTYTGSAFSPSTITINKGDTVTFVAAAGAGAMWVASNPHPTHQGYDGTTESQHCAPGYAGAAPFDECANQPSFTFTFDKVGTWGYHNHENERVEGTVIVQ